MASIFGAVAANSMSRRPRRFEVSGRDELGDEHVFRTAHRERAERARSDMASRLTDV